MRAADAAVREMLSPPLETIPTVIEATVSAVKPAAIAITYRLPGIGFFGVDRSGEGVSSGEGVKMCRPKGNHDPKSGEGMGGPRGAGESGDARRPVPLTE